MIDYPETTWKLDDKNELAISTYRACCTRIQTSIPYVYEVVRWPEAVYFQFFVRDASTKTGPDPYVQSILVRSFTYQLADAPAVTLITGYRSNFWMQDHPHQNASNPNAKTPVSCVPGQRVTVRADLTLNDQDRFIEGILTCRSRDVVVPLFLVRILEGM